MTRRFEKNPYSWRDVTARKAAGDILRWIKKLHPKMYRAERWFEIDLRKKTSFGATKARIAARVYFSEDKDSPIKTEGSVWAKEPEIMRVKIFLPDDFGPKYHEELFIKVMGTIKHELEHWYQIEIGRPGALQSEYVTLQSEAMGHVNASYFLQPVEVEAFVAGLYLKAKKTRRPIKVIFAEVMRKIGREYGISSKDQRRILLAWTKELTKRYPQAPTLNPQPLSKRDRGWNELLIDGKKKLTRRQVLNYYKDNARKIWPYLKGQTVVVVLAPQKNKFVSRRNGYKDDGKSIRLTKLKGIDDESSLEFWIMRRAIEFRPVLTTKTTPLLWLDLDMHTTPRAKRSRLLSKMKKASRKIKKVFHEFGVRRVHVYEGDGIGLHFEGDLPKRRNVDVLRKAFVKALAKAFSDDEVFTTGLANPGQIRLDTTTFRHMGSLRAPYSMTITGHAKRKITV